MSVALTPPPPPPPPPVVSNPALDSGGFGGRAGGNIGTEFSQALFNQINSNTADAGVSQQEFDAYLQGQGNNYDSAAVQEWFDSADTSGDDFLSYQEMEQAWDDFAQLGSPSGAESSSNGSGNSGNSGSEGSGKGGSEGASGCGGSEGAGKCGGSGGAGGAGGASGGSGLGGLWEALLKMFDKDGDGKIDAEELEAMKSENPELAEKLEGLLEKAGIDPAEGITQEKLQGAVDSGKITEAEMSSLTEGLSMN